VKKKRFLKKFEEYGTILHAANAVNIDRSTVTRWRKKDANFAEAFEESDCLVTENLEKRALDLALAGDITLIIFLLKCRNVRYQQNREGQSGKNSIREFVPVLVGVVNKHLPDYCPGCQMSFDFRSRIIEGLNAAKSPLGHEQIMPSP